METRTVTDGQRQQMIADAAYFRAERRGFNDCDTLINWLEAEAEVDTRLRQIEEDEALIETLEKRLAIVGTKLQELRRKVATMKDEARAEWQQDLEKLAQARDAFEKRLADMREQGRRASHKMKEQAEDAWDDVCDIIERMGRTARTHKK